MKGLQICVFVLLFFVHQSAYAQWTQAPGEYYAKVQLGGAAGSQAFALDAELIPVEDFAFYSLGLYGEVGIDENTTLGITGGLGTASYGEESTFYLTPFVISASNQLYKSDHLAMASVAKFGFSAGVNSDDLSANPVLEFRTSTELAYLGEGILQIGINYGAFFSALSAGGRYHSAYGVDILANLAIGYGFENGIVPILSLNYNHALEKPTIVNITGTGATRYFGLGLDVGWWMTDHVGLLVEVATAPYAVSNAGAPFIGIGMQFK